MSKAAAERREVLELTQTVSSRSANESLEKLIASGQKFENVVMTMPGYLLDLPEGEDENTEEAQSSADNHSHLRPDFWKITDELYPAVNQNDDRKEESHPGQNYSLQRTHLFTNGSIGFAPLWNKGPSKANDNTNAYEAGVWELFEVLECSGLQQFNNNTDLRLGSKNLFGGRDNIAEGASYRICTRLMSAKSEPKVVAVKVIKGSLLQLQSKSKEQAAASRLQTIRKDVEIMTRQQYRKMHGHPHVMTCLGYGWDVIHSELSVFVVVPLAERGTLRQFLLADEISYQVKKEIFKQVCLGLRSLHRYDIAHGDIKMENVLVFNRPHLQTEEGRRVYEEARKKHPHVPPISENVNIRLSDFGCSLASSDDTYTGTTAYNAPEVRNGEVNKTANDGTMTKFIKCDMFSCGLLFLEILLNGGSIASNSDVQSMTLDEGELPVLHFARKIALDITNDRRWGQRGGAIASDLWNNIFNATLKFDPHQRHFVDYVLNEIEQATWRATFPSDDHDMLKSIIRKPGTLNLYDPIHQLNQVGTSFKPTPTYSLAPKFENMPRPIISQLFSSWYETSMNREGKSANEAADRLIMSCLDRKWTMVTNTNELISILDNLARLSHGQAASFLYYRLLHSLGRPIPKILVDDARNQGILDLEYNLLSPFLSQAEHEYQRMRSYRKLRRSKADGATPEELAAEQARLGIPKENVAFTLWQCSALRHLFYSLDALIWLVQINAVSVLEDLLSQDCTLLNKDTESAHRLLIIACKTGHLKTMECLIRAGKLTFEDFEPPEGFTPFHFLSMFDHGDVGAAISLFLEAKYDIDAFIDKDNAIEYTFWPERELWGTPLCIAAMHDRKDIVHALLDNGADIRSAGRHRSSPINIAARYNRPDILELLCSKIKHKEDIEMNPLRTLTIGCPFAQELTNGRNKQHAIERTVTTLLKYDFDINEKIEKIPSLGYAIEMNVFERCLHDCDFTVDFGVLDALLDNGFNSELSVSSLPQYLGKHHEKIQVRLMDYLIERRLITASSDLLSLLCNLIYRGMAGALRVIMSRLPESRPILNESVSSRLPLTPFHLAVNIDADIDLMEVLLDFGGSMDDVMPNLNPETPGRPKTIFEEVATFGRSEVVDLFIDRGVELLPESLLALCSDRNFRVHGKHILNHLLRRSEADPDQFRHPRLVILLAEEVNNGFLYDRLLDIGVVSFNLDIILCLISFGVKLSEKLYQDFVLKLISHALIASCADEDTKNQYTKGKGFESMRQFLVAIWKLLIHWALQREGLEDDLAFSYLHWASMIFSPEIVRELIDGGADVFAKGSLGHTPLDVVALPYRTEVEDQLRVFSTLFGEQLAMTTPSTFISPSDLVPDPQTLRICLGKAMIGQLQFQLRKLTTLQILNDRMLSERSKVLGSSWDNEDDQIWVYISNFWVVAQGFEDAVYMKTWLETPTGEEDETYVSLMYPSPIII